MSAPKGMQVSAFVARPGHGGNGKVTKVMTNYFKVEKMPDGNIFHYDVVIRPPGGSGEDDLPPAKNRNIFKRMSENQGVGAFGDIKPIYDGRKNIFTAKRLPFGQSATFEIAIKNERRPHKDPDVYTVQLTLVNELVLEELVRYVEGKGGLTNNILTSVQALDILLRHEPSFKYPTVGRSFYVPAESTRISGGATLYRGYYQSIRAAQGQLLVNVDITATAFRSELPLIEYATIMSGKRSAEELSNLSDRDRRALERNLKGVHVKTTHREGNKNMSEKITKILPTNSRNTSFEMRRGEETESSDVASYFQKTYGVRLQFPQVPCINVRKNTALPMEVCTVLPEQRLLKKLNPEQTADMIKFSAMRPNQRMQAVSNARKLLGYDSSPYLREFGLKISNNLMQVRARVLQAPQLNYHSSSREPRIQPRDGAWNLRDKKVVVSSILHTWSVVVFGQERMFPMPMIQGFVRQLVQTAQATGMNITNATPPITHANPSGDMKSVLKNAGDLAVQASAQKSRPQLILCILPNKGIGLYADIKHASDCTWGIVTQCVQASHVRKAQPQYCANVTLKMNVKLRGTNVHLSPGVYPFLDGNQVILGADVSHPAPGSDRPSIAAVVGSVDLPSTRYAAEVRVQTSRQETIADLGECVKSLLKQYYANTKKKPTKLLMFRDGVSEGQFATVMEQECQAIQDACASLEAGYKPTITFVTCIKRHHTRFFPANEREADRSGNCLAGTVVDTEVVHPNDFDFYIQSHGGLLGTSRPTKYTMLRDDNKFTPDTIQELIYALCSTYARATRTVSLAPPAYYADIVAERARFHSKSGIDSDSMSMVSGGSEEMSDAGFAALHDQLKGSMWYM